MWERAVHSSQQLPNQGHASDQANTYSFEKSSCRVLRDDKGEFRSSAHWAPFLAWSVSQSNDFGFRSFCQAAHCKLDRLLVPSPPSSPPPIGSSRSLEGKLSPFLSHFRHSPLHRHDDAHLDRPGDARRSRPQDRTCHQLSPAVPPGPRHLQPYTCQY